MNTLNILNERPACPEHIKEKFDKWQSENKDTIIETGDFIQIKFIEDHKHPEWMWVKVTSVSNDIITGNLDNDPVNLTNIKYEDEVSTTRYKIINLLKQ